ncbi:MAG: hypothetical protein WCT08_04115 [Patescibacteria group bacterium]|jgi:hypothetical protein
MKKKVAAVIVVAVIVIIGGCFLMNWHYHNAQIRSKNLVEQKQEACKAHFDLMWKAISQVAKIPEAAKAAFTDMYKPLIDGRYSADSNGVLMKWIQENNPTFDWSLYKQVQSTVVAERTAFFKDQEMLLDMNKEYKNLIQTIPGRWFLNPSDTLEITIITSGKTKDAYKTGEENDVNLFEKK